MFKPCHKSLLLLFILSVSAFLQADTAQTHVQAKHAQEKEWKDLYQQTILAMLWQQHSAENQALSWQTFNMAADTIDRQLATLDTHTTRPTLVTDLDDTIVNATAYFAGFIGTNNQRTDERDRLWWHQQPADPRPGALHFLRSAHDKGVEILYLTARVPEPQVFDDTLAMLQRLGAPGLDRDHLQISPGYQKSDFIRNWGRTSGRQLLLTIGDKFADLGIDLPIDTRLQQQWIIDHPDQPGQTSLIQTNVAYGRWECITHGECPHSPDQEHQQRREEAQSIAGGFRHKPNELAEAHPYHSGEETGQLLQWLTQSAEYSFITRQIFNRASEYWKASKSSDGTAVIVDVDGTVVQNIELQPFIFLHDTSLRTTDLFNLWASFNLPPKIVPGAKEFLQSVTSAGGDIFYVTNRTPDSYSKQDMRSILLQTLKRAGLPVQDEQHVLMRGDFDPTGSRDKSLRFQAIQNGQVTGKPVHVVQWVGDRIEDIGLTEDDLDLQPNAAPNGRLADLGRQRFLIPFPLHTTGWLSRLYKRWYGDQRPQTSAEQLRQKRIEKLDRWTEASIK